MRLQGDGPTCIDAAPSTYEARAGELVFLGGVTGRDHPNFHDRHNMLERLDLLPYDHIVLYLSESVGIALIFMSL